MPILTPGATRSPPRFWTVDAGGTDGVRLTYAIRGGAGHFAIVMLGVALLLGGLYALFWLMAGGGLTAAGYVLLLLPAAVVVFAVYVLDIAWLARTTYLLGGEQLVWSHHGLFARKSLAIPRSSVRAITQQYSPPGPSAPAGAPGDWTTFVTYQPEGARKPSDFALKGLASPEEAAWLGPLLANWGEVRLERGFGPALEEADPAELPEI